MQSRQTFVAAHAKSNSKRDFRVLRIECKLKSKQIHCIFVFHNFCCKFQISSPSMWRICTKCNYEILHILKNYLQKTTSRSHPSLPNGTSCYSCGKKQITDYDITDLVMKIRETGLAVPSFEIYACFECIHTMETVVKYMKLLQSSQIWEKSVRPYQKLTETINTAKRSATACKRKRSNSVFPLWSLPPLRNCTVTLKKLNFSSPNEISSVCDETSRSPKRPVKLRKGGTWDEFGRTNGFLKPQKQISELNINRTTKAGDAGDCLNGFHTDIETTFEQRTCRKRKRLKQDDFIYELNNLCTLIANSSNIQKKSRMRRKRFLKAKSPSIIKIKPCYVLLKRLPPIQHTPVPPIIEDIPQEPIDLIEKDPLSWSSEDECEPEEAVVAPEILTIDFQNENMAPNIPEHSLPVSENSTNAIENKEDSQHENSIEPLLYESPLSKTESTPIRGILSSPIRSFGDLSSSKKKSVSFSTTNQWICFEAEEPECTTPEVAEEIEVNDLHDNNMIDSEDDQEEHFDDDNQDEVNKVIHEILSQQY